MITDWFEELQNTSGQTITASDETAEQVIEGGGNRPDRPNEGHWGHLIGRAEGTSAIYQNLGIWNTGDATSYIFSMLLGDRSNQPFMDLTVEFFSVDEADQGSGADGQTFGSSFSTRELLASGMTGIISGGPNNTTFPQSGDDTRLAAPYSDTLSFNTSNLTNGDAIWLRISGPTVEPLATR